MPYNVGKKASVMSANISPRIKRKTLLTTKAIHLWTGKAKTLGPGKVKTLELPEGKTPVVNGVKTPGWGRSRCRASLHIYIQQSAPKKIPNSRRSIVDCRLS